MLNIRVAKPVDAAGACLAVRQSIIELCVRDHGNDPASLKRWLANKTPEQVERWVDGNPDGCFVAERDGEVVALGMINRDGFILLNYVAPSARFLGVSKSLMATMEDRALAWGHDACRLRSTMTAHQFYQGLGYVDDGVPEPSFANAVAYPMCRQLQPSR